jgi:arylsulfatase A-like enzyme
VGVPPILKYKGVIPAGQRDRTHLVSTGLDILPTICDYVGVKKPAHLLGIGLRQIAEGNPVEEWRSYVASENGWSRMIRSRRFKYCVYDSDKIKESLLDMEKDPGEMQNLVGDSKFQVLLAEHSGLLAEWVKISDDKEGYKYLTKG